MIGVARNASSLPGRLSVPARIVFSAIIAAALCSGCTVPTDGKTAAAQEVPNSEDATQVADASPPVADASFSSWQLTGGKDPMSDEVVVSVQRSFRSSPYIVDVMASCGEKQPLRYKFALFDEERRPVALDGGSSDSLLFYVRADGSQQFSGYATERGPANTFSADDEPFRTHYKEHNAGLEMAKARNILLRFVVDSSPVTVAIEQTDENVRYMLDACIRRSEIREKQAAAAAAPDATSPANLPAAESSPGQSPAPLARGEEAGNSL